MDKELDHEVEGIELLVVVEDGLEIHECTYSIDYTALDKWESMDLHSEESGFLLVRTLVLLKLREHNYSLYKLLLRNCYPAEFIQEGISASLLVDIPRLNLVNAIVDKVYDTLSSAVVEIGFRVMH